MRRPLLARWFAAFVAVCFAVASNGGALHRCPVHDAPPAAAAHHHAAGHQAPDGGRHPCQCVQQCCGCAAVVFRAPDVGTYAGAPTVRIAMLRAPDAPAPRDAYARVLFPTGPPLVLTA